MNAAKDILRVLDRKETMNDVGLKQAAENIALFAQDSKLPRVIEYTSLAGSFGRLCAETSRTTLGPLDTTTKSWLLEGKESDKLKNTLYLNNDTKFLQLIEPWKAVLLRDCLWYLKNDKDLGVFLQSLSRTITPETDVIFALDGFKTGARNDEVLGVIITRKVEAVRPRVFKRTTKVRTVDESATLEEELLVWKASDIYACAKAVGYKPAGEFLNLDPTRFAIYRLKD